MWLDVTMVTFILHTRPLLPHQPTCWQGQRASEKCDLSKNLDVWGLGRVRLELGMCLLL